MNSFQNEAIKTTCWQTIVSSAESFTSFSTRKFCVFRNGPRGGLFLSCDWHFAVFPATVNQSLKANFTHDRTVDSSNLSYVPKGQNKTAAGSGCFYWNHRQWCVCSLCPFISKCISWMCVRVCVWLHVHGTMVYGNLLKQIQCSCKATNTEREAHPCCWCYISLR